MDDAALKKSITKRRWPMIPVDDLEGPEEMFCLTDAEMILVKVVLRQACQQLPEGDPLGARLESARLVIENALDVEFNEGRFAPEPTEPRS